MTVLIIEGDVRLADVIRRARAEAGYATNVAHDVPVLMRNAGRIVSSTEFIDHAWDSNYEGDRVI